MDVVPIKHWSALLPLAMSAAGLGLIFGHLALAGTVRAPDEGTAAHLWQLLMAAEVPAIGFFAFTWLPRAARQALLILAVQAAAVVANLVSLYVLER